MSRCFPCRCIAGCCVAALAIGLLASRSFSADDAAKKAAAEKQAAEMAEYMKMSQPGPEHDKLKEMEGDWAADVKMFNPDGTEMGPPSTGVMHCKMILGGRYLQLNYDGNMGGPGGATMPFRGMGLSGYDKTKKKYTNVWIDEMSTGMMMTEGTCTGDVLTSTGEMPDPMTGKICKVKEVNTMTDKDHHKYEMYMTEGGSDKEMKVMEINYTRKA